MALQLGYPHPDYLLQYLTASQLEGWKTYASLEPFGEYRQELRHGQMMHLLDRAHFKRDEPVTPLDFMNFMGLHKEPERELTVDELEAYADEVLGI